jgi:hypothetical protein
MDGVPQLDGLVAIAAAQSKSGDPLDRLAAAAQLRDALDERAEAVLDHFVDEARQAGCSWSEVGSALGVSKQAAQQRHAATDSIARRLLSRLAAPRGEPGGFVSGGVFRRFTSAAREAVVRAQSEARALGHDSIGTEHLLLGLLSAGTGPAASTLKSLHIARDDVRNDIIAIVGFGGDCSRASAPFTPRARKALELSLRESIRLKHNYVGTEHILLGLVRVPQGLAARILTERGADEDRVRTALLSLLADRRLEN